MNHDRSVLTAEDADGRSWAVFRRTGVSLLIAFALLPPASTPDALTTALTTGPAGRAASRAEPAFAGSGLAGPAERVRSLGGDLAAGAVEPQGFLLRVVVPCAPQAGQ